MKVDKGARALSLSQFFACLAAAPPPRDKALVAMLGYSGGRLTETRTMLWGQVYDFKRQRWRTHVSFVKSSTKGRREGRRVPLAEPLKPYLAQHKATVGAGDEWPIFTGNDPAMPLSRSAAQRALERVFAEALPDVDNLSSHSFRRFFGHQLRDRGHSIQAIGRLLGHSDLRTTELYLGDPPREQLRAAVDSIPAPPPQG